MNFKNALTAVVLMLASQLAYAQQDFRTEYNFGKISGADVLFKKLDSTTGKYLYFDPAANGNFLKGVIIKKTEEGKLDTFFVKLWPVKTTTGLGTSDSQRKILPSNSIISQNPKGDNKYIIIVKDYHAASNTKIDIPFRTWQLTEVTIPLRYNPSTKKMSSEFLNANMSYSYIWGKTRFYENEFVKPRDRYIGLGGFAGLGMTKNSLDEDEVGVLYGANVILSAFNINFLFAYGFESAIGKNSKTSNYIGFGVGFDLFKLSGVKKGSE